jgi:hypothetical protein
VTYEPCVGRYRLLPLTARICLPTALFDSTLLTTSHLNSGMIIL